MNVARICTGLTAACTLALGMSVQAQTPTTPATRPAAPSTSPQPAPGPGGMGGRMGQHPSVTLSGCVQRDAPGASGQAASGQAASSGAMFKLTNAKPVPMTPPAASASTATAGSTAGSTAPAAAQRGEAAMKMESEYRLMAMGSVNIAPHVNHQVTVTGMVMPMAGAMGASQAAQPAGAAQSAAPAMAPMFHVTELTMVSATCTP